MYMYTIFTAIIYDVR